MRQFPKFRVAVLACLIALARPAGAEPVDAVLATVDKEVVLLSEIMADVGAEVRNLQQTATSESQFNESADALVRQALEESINSRLLVREAKKIPELEVTDKVLDLEMEKIRKRFDTPEDFIKAVGGSVTDFRERKRQQFMAQQISAMKMQSFESQVVISEDEIAPYYQEHAADWNKPERIFLRQIFLRVQGGDAEREQARAKLQTLRDEISAGTAFADLAKLHSQGPEAAEGGAIGWQQPGDLVEPLNTAAFALPAGGLSEVIDSQFGVHLLRADEHEAAGSAALNEVRLEIEKILRQNAAKKKFDTWLADLRKRSRVRIFL